MKRILLVILVLSVASICYAQDEEITLTTYYPAPYGEYAELSTEVLNLVPSTEPTANIGNLYYSISDNVIYYRDNNSWKRLNASTFGSPGIGGYLGRVASGRQESTGSELTFSVDPISGTSFMFPVYFYIYDHVDSPGYGCGIVRYWVENQGTSSVKGKLLLNAHADGIVRAEVRFDCFE